MEYQVYKKRDKEKEEKRRSTKVVVYIYRRTLSVRMDKVYNISIEKLEEDKKLVCI